MTNADLLDVTLLEPRLHPIGSATAAVEKTRRSARPAFSLGDPGACPPCSTLTMFLSDDSASLTGQSGNDPLAQRYHEALRAIEHISRACRCRNELVSIIHFDYPSHLDVPPQRLHRRGMRRLRSGLCSEGLPGSSDLAPALDKAEQLAGKFGGGESTLVVLSDFLLTDRDPRGVLEQLVSFDGQVHAVVLGAKPPTILHDAPHVAVTTITPTSVRGATAQAIFDGLMTHRQS